STSAMWAWRARSRRSFPLVCCCSWCPLCTSGSNGLLSKMTGNQMRNKLSLLTVTLLCAIAAAAQQPYRARLPAVTERGFYKILIHPEITAYAGMSGDDIRILSPDGGEVPYLKEESRALRRSDLQLFNIISSENG